MAVYKIDSRVSDMGGEVFILHFCSPEILRNSRVRLSKSYDGNISDTVNRILKDKKSVNTKKDLFIESTLGNKKIVSPNKNPYSLIKDLTTDAISKDGSPNFVFYENTSGIHFRTLESILSELSKQVAIALKENEVQDVMIEELKLSTNNPLSN